MEKPHKKVKQKKCGFFDVDGTLLRGYIIQSFPRYLADNGYIQTKYANKIDKIITNYDKKKIEYREAAERVAILYALGLKGKHKSEISLWSKEFMNSYVPSNILSYTKKLISHIKNLVDIIIAVSGSPIEPIKELKFLGFDQLFGSLIESENGIYTGKVVANLILGEKKAQTAKKISKELNIDLTRSVAFGDTDQDAFLLNMVGLPLAINPNKKLRKICSLKDWLILDVEELQDLTRITNLIKKL